MRINKEVKTIQQEILTYVAEDGTEFERERDCRNYELDLEQQNMHTRSNKLCVLCDYPPCDGGDNSQDRYYKWFLVYDENELELINECYGTEIKCIHYPEHVCVEYDEDLIGYGRTLTDCKDYVIELFNKLGFDVDIKPMKH